MSRRECVAQHKILGEKKGEKGDAMTQAINKLGGVIGNKKRETRRINGLQSNLIISELIDFSLRVALKIMIANKIRKPERIKITRRKRRY